MYFLNKGNVSLSGRSWCQGWQKIQKKLIKPINYFILGFIVKTELLITFKQFFNVGIKK